MNNNAQLDALSAFDHESIGREFVSVGPTVSQKREKEERRSQLLVESWKSTITDSQRIPKSSLRNTCKYDTQKAASQSMITICVYVISACAAGVVIALLIKNLPM